MDWAIRCLKGYIIPAAQAGEHTNIGTIGTAIGFALMMVLDVALG
jgi:ZIP family zinc transporter